MKVYVRKAREFAPRCFEPSDVVKTWSGPRLRDDIDAFASRVLGAPAFVQDGDFPSCFLVFVPSTDETLFITTR